MIYLFWELGLSIFCLFILSLQKASQNTKNHCDRNLRKQGKVNKTNFPCVYKFFFIRDIVRLEAFGQKATDPSWKSILYLCFQNSATGFQFYQNSSSFIAVGDVWLICMYNGQAHRFLNWIMDVGTSDDIKMTLFQCIRFLFVIRTASPARFGNGTLVKYVSIQKL